MEWVRERERQCVCMCVCVHVCVRVCMHSCMRDWADEDSFSVVAQWLSLWLRTSHFVSTNSHEENDVLTIVQMAMAIMKQSGDYYASVRSAVLCLSNKINEAIS